MRAFLNRSMVPVVVLIFTALYWLHIQGAPAAAQRVPLGVIVFILIMCVIVILRDIKLAKDADLRAGDADTQRGDGSLRSWFVQWRPQIVFTVLGIGYFVAFVQIGFNLANFLFLLLALPAAGMGRGSRPGPAALRILATALIASAVFLVLALVMDFNVPLGILGF